MQRYPTARPAPVRYSPPPATPFALLLQCLWCGKVRPPNGGRACTLPPPGARLYLPCPGPHAPAGKRCLHAVRLAGTV